MTECTEIEDKNEVNQPNERFLSREPIVLLTVICLSMSQAMTIALQPQQLRGLTIDTRYSLIQIWGVCSTAATVIGMVLIAFISELHGRKPVFVILSVLSIFSAILHSFPSQLTCLLLGYVVDGIARGGTVVMSAVAISEYCCAKHRFAYQLANAISSNTLGPMVIYFLFKTEAISTFPYIQSFQIVLELVCLGSIWKWPESPYWLASKERLEESRESFLWLRGKEGGKELHSVMEERRRPGPLRLYWMPFFIAMTATSVTVFSSLQDAFVGVVFISSESSSGNLRNIIIVCSAIVICAVTVLISYFVRRKIMFLVVSAISVALTYTIGVWLHVDPEITNSKQELFDVMFLVDDIFRKYGPALIGHALFIEVIPPKYNTHICCVSKVYYHVFYFLFVSFANRLPHERSTLLVLVLTLAALLLVGAILYYCFAPETNGSTLLEIQNMYYTPKQRAAHSASDQIVMQNIESGPRERTDPMLAIFRLLFD